MIFGFNIATNRKVRIFISSTFQDMYSEREILIKNVFPALRAEFKNRNVEIVDIDLRWGITKEMVDDVGIVASCLKEVFRCKPFFIGLVGGRYGYVPYESNPNATYLQISPFINTDKICGMSITEMEIRIGALNNRENTFASFYLKDVSPVIDYRLSALRNEILNQDRFPFFTYGNVDELYSHVYETLRTHINARYPNNIEDMEGDIEYYDHLNILKNHLLFYVPNPDFDENIFNMTHNVRNICIHGRSGSGKSSILSKLIDKIGNEEGSPLFFHFSTANNGSTHVDNMMKRLYAHMCSYIEIEPEIVSDYENAVLQTLPLLKDDIYIFIDAPEYMFRDESGRPMPSTKLSVLFHEKVHLIIASTEIFPGFDTIEVKYLMHNQKINILLKSMGEYGKSLSHDHASKLSNNPLYDIPIYLNIMMNELRMFGSHSGLDLFINEFAETNDEIELFGNMFKRLREDYRERNGNPKYIDEVFQLILLSDRGLTETEIMGMVRIPAVLWVPIYSSIEPLIIENRGRISFKHKIIEEQVLQNIKEAQSYNEKTSRKKILSYMKNSMAHNAPFEISFQLYMLNRKLSLIRHICRPNVFEHMFNEDYVRLIKYLSSAMSYQDAMFSYISKHIDSLAQSNVSSMVLNYTKAMLESGNHRCVKKIVNKYIHTLSYDEEISALNFLSRSLYKTGENRGKASIESYRRLVGLIGEVHPNDEVMLASVRFKYAIALTTSGKFNDAFSEYERSISVYKRARTADRDSIWAQNNYAYICNTRGLLKEATLNFEEALSLSNEMYGNNSTLSAWFMCYKWANDMHIGNYESSKQCVIDANRIHGELLGKESMEYAWSIMNLASIEMIEGRYDEAEEHYLESIRLNDRARYSQGRPHRYSLTPLENLCLLNFLKGDERVISDMKRTIRCRIDILGEDNARMGNTFHNYAVVSELIDPCISNKMYLRAILVYEDAHLYPDCIFTIINYSRFLFKRGDYNSAYTLLKDAIKRLNGNESSYLSRLVAQTVLAFVGKENILHKYAMDELRKTGDYRDLPCYVSHNNVSQMVLVSKIPRS